MTEYVFVAKVKIRIKMKISAAEIKKINTMPEENETSY